MDGGPRISPSLLLQVLHLSLETLGLALREMPEQFENRHAFYRYHYYDLRSVTGLRIYVVTEIKLEFFK